MRLKKEIPEYEKQKKYFEYLMKCDIGKFRQNIYTTIRMGTLFCIVGQNKHNTIFKELSKPTLELILKLNILIIRNYEYIHEELNLDKFQSIRRAKISFLVTEIKRKFDWVLLGGDENVDDDYYEYYNKLIEEWNNSLEKKEYLKFGEAFYE